MERSDVECSMLTGSMQVVRSASSQGIWKYSSPLKIPLPPRIWMTDASSASSDEESEGVEEYGKPRTRLRHRNLKHKHTSVPIGIFWDIENCQVPRGCSAVDVVAAIRARFLAGRREADFVVVCDVRKESPARLQELNDSQVNLIHVCGTQKNASDDKLRQCMRRFGEIHGAPAALLLISGDINFAADLSDFRHRKSMEVILVHKQNTSSALITCATSHYCYNELTSHLPRNAKSASQSEQEDSGCHIEVGNLPGEPATRLARRLRRLGDNCGGRVVRIEPPVAVLRFPTPDHAARALKRMDGEDVFGNKISTRNVRPRAPPAPAAPAPPAYSSDEGYATAQSHTQRGPSPAPPGAPRGDAAAEWRRALQQLPLATLPVPRPFSQPRQIRGTHGSNLDQSAGSDEARAVSPWNWSSYSEPSSEEGEADLTDLTVTNLPAVEPGELGEMLRRLFAEYVPVVKVSVRCGADGPIATITLISECDARIAISRLHRRRLDGKEWSGRRLELSLGRCSPGPSADVVKARLRRLLLEQPDRRLPLLRLRDVYASRHACALTSSDLARVRDTVIVHEGNGRIVELVNTTPPPVMEEEAPWKCRVHSGGAGYEDGNATLIAVYIEMSMLARNVHVLLGAHNGVLPLMSFMDCYESMFPPLLAEPVRGVALELLLRAVPGVALREHPSRHLAWAAPPSNSSGDSSEARVAPALAPLRTLLERELLDLLKTEPKCSIPFSKFIPAYHRHFSRQLRVADYGFTKLPELLAVLTSTVVVIGSGSSRIITLSYPAQGRRWTNDLVKLLKNHCSRYLHLKDLPQLYHKMFGVAFNPADYGACTVSELMGRVSSQSVVMGPDGTISLPRREPTPEELARSHHFSNETIEILSLTPNLRIKFSQFVPTYHAHFSRQCRVSYYGCTKLAELFELIPNVVTVRNDPNGERVVCLSPRPAKVVMAARLKAFTSVPIQLFAKIYNQRFGAPPQPDSVGADTIEEMILSSGGYVSDGIVYGPGDAPQWTNQILTVCAVLSSDRSIASDGSSSEYFVSGYKDRTGEHPPTERLVRGKVIACRESRVILSGLWRAAWRTAVTMATRPAPIDVRSLYEAYYARYEMHLPYMELGFESTSWFLRNFPELFSEVHADVFALCAGVAVPASAARPQLDLTIYDTPPGQKGSRVFDTPPSCKWASPPACALPSPAALLASDTRRRVRLAAQFGLAPTSTE